MSQASQPLRPPNANPDYVDPRVEFPDFASLAYALNTPLTPAAGPTFQTETEEIRYSNKRLDPRTYVYPYSAVPFSTLRAGPTTIGNIQTSKEVDSVIMLQSKDRDTTLFPQPTECKLFLPRNYKNVIKFSIAQIGLTSAFFYFSASKNNVSIQIYEKDSLLYENALVPPPSTTPLINTRSMRDGSYNIDQIITELQTKLNTTPLFYDFPNGFTDFFNTFQTTGDYTLNFNYPGDYYYDALQKVYIQNPTRAQIVSHYFQSQYANQFNYTSNQIYIAYYYPVLKEFLLDPDYNPLSLDYSTTGLAPADAVQYIIFNFQGINDPIVLATIKSNSAVLDNYRLAHTFRYSLVNKYVLSYSQTNNRVTIQTPTLNTSLVNLLTAQYNAYLTQQLNLYNISAAEYNALAARNAQTQSVLQAMYNNLQINFANYFAVNYGSYSKFYFTNFSNSMLIRDGQNAAGVITSYGPSNSTTMRDTDTLNDFRVNPPNYWPNMTKLTAPVEGPPRNMGGSNAFPYGSNYPYNIYSSNIDLTFSQDPARRFINPSDYSIYTDARRSAGDILIDVAAGKYTIFQFRSKYRQTLQVETLPRQTAFRYPAWNAANATEYPTQTLFDLSYSYVISPDQGLSNVTPFTISYNPVAGSWSNLSGTSNYFGINFANSSNLWGSNYEFINITSADGLFYYFQTPLPTSNTPGAYYTYNLSLTFATPDGNNFPSDLSVFFYHDIAAFSADISPANVRKENPINYKQLIQVSSNTSSNTYTFKTFANQQYYLLVRSSSAIFSTTNYVIVPWFPDGTTSVKLSSNTDFDSLADPSTMLSNAAVAINNDPAFIRLPTASNLYSNAVLNEPINNTLYKDPTPIGYDANGISTDLTDYIATTTNPSETLFADPITNYLFKYSSPYNTNTYSYFGSNSTNAILTKSGAAPYTPAAVDHRQYKIVNYNTTNYLQDVSDPATTSSNIAPYTSATTSGKISGYIYNSNASNALTLGGGACGFMFVPGAGTWAIERISFKANFINPATDPNIQSCHLLAVFYTSEVHSRSISLLSLSNALAICLRTSTTTYSNSANLNLGFDSTLGTYYTFSNYPSLVTRTGSSATISGFNELSQTFVNDPNSYYSVLAYQFTSPEYANWNISNVNIAALSNELVNTKAVRIQNMTGSAIPYPQAYQAYTSNTFYDGSITPSGNGLVLSTSNATTSNYGPKGANDFSMLQYEQSIPIVNTNIHYFSLQDIVNNTNPFNDWTGLPFSPSFIDANIPNRILFQDRSFSITSYTTYDAITSATPAARIFTTKASIGPEEIYPDGDKTALIAVAGNNSNYCFLGAAPTADPLISQLRFKIYDPATGILIELPQNPNYQFSNSLLLQHFVYHNTGRWFMTSLSVGENKIILQGADIYDAALSTTYVQRTYTGASAAELQMDPAGSRLYFATLASPSSGFTQMTVFTFDPSDTTGYAGSASAPGYAVALQRNIGTLPSYYKQLTVNIVNLNEEILLTNYNAAPYNFYKITSYYAGVTLASSNTFIEKSVAQVRNDRGTLVTPSRIIGGYGGSTWLLFSGQASLMGNRNDAYDSPIVAEIAWQIFFPTMKIQMQKLTNGYSPMEDLTSLQYPEWPHTAMFSYKGLSNLQTDLHDSQGYKWGNESSNNFLTSDTKFDGFYFNSYIANVPLLPNYVGGNSNTDYYLAVRGWLPTEQFQTMLRFYLPNKYDFGYIRIMDLINEIEIGKQASNISEFNPQYLNNLLTFNSNYTFSGVSFGKDVSTGFPGCNLSSSNFGDFMGQYNGFYSTLSTNVKVLTDIQTNLSQQMSNFLITDMKYILPVSSITRQRFTDPLLFQIQWESQLTPQYMTLVDSWGLGWNLGFTKQDTGFSTTFTGSSFYKIQDDFIYLRLNPEFNINRMDSGAKENYSQTREPSGITNQYYCKLLLTSFGGNATTFIHNPIEFTPPINRLSQLQFQWIGSDGAVISNFDSEWDMTVNIAERADVIPVQQTSVPFFQNTPFAVVMNDTSSQIGDALPPGEMKKLTEPDDYEQP